KERRLRATCLCEGNEVSCRVGDAARCSRVRAQTIGKGVKRRSIAESATDGKIAAGMLVADNSSSGGFDKAVQFAAMLRAAANDDAQPHACRTVRNDFAGAFVEDLVREHARCCKPCQRLGASDGPGRFSPQIHKRLQA